MNLVLLLLLSVVLFTLSGCREAVSGVPEAPPRPAAVTDLPPALVAEAPVAADLKLFGETLPERGAPFVMRGHVRSAGLRAPPALA